MVNEQDFAKELNALIKRYLDMGCDPQDIADELAREANSVFGHFLGGNRWGGLGLRVPL